MRKVYLKCIVMLALGFFVFSPEKVNGITVKQLDAVKFSDLVINGAVEAVEPYSPGKNILHIKIISTCGRVGYSDEKYSFSFVLPEKFKAEVDDPVIAFLNQSGDAWELAAPNSFYVGESNRLQVLDALKDRTWIYDENPYSDTSGYTASVKLYEYLNGRYPQYFVGSYLCISEENPKLIIGLTREHGALRQELERVLSGEAYEIKIAGENPQVFVTEIYDHFQLYQWRAQLKSTYFVESGLNSNNGVISVGFWKSATEEKVAEFKKLHFNSPYTKFAAVTAMFED